MQAVCADFTVETARNTITRHVAQNAKMITDGYSTYQSLAGEFAMDVEKVPSKQAHIKLPWVHTAIGNAKKVLQGIYQHTRPGYLQNYLDEFCYKLNRRYFENDIFDRILIACTLT
ncbi:IS1595 family transposase [Chondrinema litorale]|uniref:IS1595 family transposase n=1 Tax=Chondrinema litorale TaxID=2994555 RepID=UPI002543719C|nr:IS1595 family transposase [Chondrinema litorale]UZR99114.1 IS1595 family transposase [Chondrinema litorale]